MAVTTLYAGDDHDTAEGIARGIQSSGGRAIAAHWFDRHFAHSFKGMTEPEIEAWLAEEYDRRAAQRNARGSVAADHTGAEQIHQEEEMTGTQTTEPLRPIYGPNDPRWAALAEWFVENQNERSGAIHDLMPVERAQWHEAHVLGVDGYEAAARAVMNVEYPAFPSDYVAPEWATATQFDDLDAETEHPVAAFERELFRDDGGAVASMVQQARFDPDSGDVELQAPRLSVWFTGDDAVEFASAEHARKWAGLLLGLADAVDGIVPSRDGALS